MLLRSLGQGTSGAITSVPYKLPDETAIIDCAITFDLPSDHKWAAVIIGAISELAREEIWEAESGGITVAQAVATAIAIRTSVSFVGICEMQIKVGTYTGDDTGALQVSGVGFQADAVLVFMEDDVSSSKGMCVYTRGTNSLKIGTDGVEFTKGINTFTSDGFWAHDEGIAGQFNANVLGKVYSYIALGE